MKTFEIDREKHEISPEESRRIKSELRLKKDKSVKEKEKARKLVAKKLGITVEELNSIL